MYDDNDSLQSPRHSDRATLQFLATARQFLLSVVHVHRPMSKIDTIITTVRSVMKSFSTLGEGLGPCKMKNHHMYDVCSLQPCSSIIPMASMRSHSRASDRSVHRTTKLMMGILLPAGVHTASNSNLESPWETSAFHSSRVRYRQL